MSYRSASEVLVDYVTKLSANNPSSENTGTFVDGSFQPATQVTGSYGHTLHSEEPDLMRTPVMPNENDAAGIVDNVKVSGLLRCKLATPQPVVPDAEQDDITEVGRSQPTAKPTSMLTRAQQVLMPHLPYREEDSAGENIGRMGGALAGGTAAAATGAPGPLPTGMGAFVGSELGGRAGKKIQEIVSSPHMEMQEEENLKDLLDEMKKQNPEFYAERAAEKQAADFKDTAVKKQRDLWEQNTKVRKPPKPKAPANLVHVPGFGRSSGGAKKAGKWYKNPRLRKAMGKGALIGGGLAGAAIGGYGLLKHYNKKGDK